MLTSILFDLDGVLADSEPSWNEIDAAFLRSYGVEYRGEHKDQVLGKSYRLAIEFYREKFALPSEIAQLLPERELIAREFYAKHIPIFPSVPGVLSDLKKHGLKIGLATSSVGELVVPFLKRHEISEFFDAITTGDEVERGKPNPDIYLKAAQKVGATPGQCLVVEDALSGITAGKAAGMRVVAIPDPRFMNLSLYPGGADFQLERLEEVPALVERLKNE